MGARGLPRLERVALGCGDHVVPRRAVHGRGRRPVQAQELVGASRLYRAAIVQSIRLASLVCVPTRAVRDDVLRVVDGVDPGRIRVIHHGISDRFRPEAVKARHRYAYLPFAGGPRVCIGNMFSIVETVILIAQLNEAIVLGLTISVAAQQPRAESASHAIWLTSSN